MTDIRSKVEISLSGMTSGTFRQSANNLLSVLGYQSERTVDLGGSTPDAFLEFLQSNSSDGSFNATKAMFADWKSVDLLFQLTDQELSGQKSLFKETEVNRGLLRSYLFFAIDLKGDKYPRGRLTEIARQINRIFPMPVMVLLKHRTEKQPVLSVAVINRRQNRRDVNKDVLGKVTIIRDISLNKPHRGHLDILSSLALPNLTHPQRLPITTFDALHSAWEEIFNVELLNKKFYRELANWYFWALTKVEFPNDTEKDAEKRNATSLIRLLTRLIFCWFLKEKGLIPDQLFNEADLKNILIELDSSSSSYYQAILQNLFFATLNQKMGKDSKGKPYRYFAKDEGFAKNKNTYGVDNLYRYEECFRQPENATDHFADVPFLNGGLFECLDRTDDKTEKKVYVDGFSRNQKKRSVVPNELFFAEQVSGIDLSEAYGERSRRSESVRGLLRILNPYKFTVVENTPIDQEIALDPELLGKVFENLLASYNEETKTTARKQTGSFYTPRPIVEYMVDESLRAHLAKSLVNIGMEEARAKDGLDILFAYTETPHPFTDREADMLLDAVHNCKILDPACGSGAFPMGMLQKLVYIIHRLDPDNAKWMQLQIDRAGTIPDPSSRDAAIKAIEQDFADNEDDYGRKLYLIENCLYGVDIQPIAIQISKLRFFISLVCDQKTNRRKKDNLGIRPLPNLETKFVAADTLISLKKDPRRSLFENQNVRRLESELQRVRHDHFSATSRQKKLLGQKRDHEIRELLAKELQHSAFYDPTAARKLAAWNPYDPQSSADYFEPLWMFDQSVQDGFDIIIGNPPYISVERFSGTPQQQKWKDSFTTYSGRGDIYCFFFERGADLLRLGGTLIFITSNKWMRAGYGEKLRRLLSSQVNTQAVLDFGMAQNFSAATTYTCITTLTTGKPSAHIMSCYATDDRAAVNSPAEYFLANALPQKSFKSDAWVVLSRTRQAIKDLVESQGVRLEDWNIRIGYGIKSGFNEAYYLNASDRATLVAADPASEALIVKLVRGREIERYKIDWDQTFQLIIPFGAHTYLEDSYPAVYRHLLRFEKQLKARGQCQRSRSGTTSTGEAYPGQHHWLELDNNPTDEYLKMFREPKIIYPEITKWLGFYLDEEDHYFPNNKGFIVTSQGDSLSYLTAFFNSSVFRCCFRDNFPELMGHTYEVRKIFVEARIRRGCSGRDVWQLSDTQPFRVSLSNKTPVNPIPLIFLFSCPILFLSHPSHLSRLSVTCTLDGFFYVLTEPSSHQRGHNE